MTDAPLIAIVDDTREIRTLLQEALEDAGFQTVCFASATMFEQSMRSLTPQVCIIDLGLPDRDGLSLVNKLSSESDAAIMIISGRSALPDRIAGLELGADDYITKPFELTEVIARVKVLLRRSKPAPVEGPSSEFRLGEWTVNLDQHVLISDSGEKKRLSYAEVKILELFTSAPNRLITRDRLLSHLREDGSETYDRAIDVRISRLRSKLGDDPVNPKIIKTIYGAGYIFIADLT
jgi:two-component system OmpR family response regulator